MPRKTNRKSILSKKRLARDLPLLPTYAMRGRLDRNLPANGRPLIEEIGRRIQSLRTERRGSRVTQTDVARKARISVSFLSMIERGQRSPSLETLGDIASALGVSLGELCRDGSEPVEMGAGVRRLVNRAKQLNRTELERLIAVADAIFSG